MPENKTLGTCQIRKSEHYARGYFPCLFTAYRAFMHLRFLSYILTSYCCYCGFEKRRSFICVYDFISLAIHHGRYLANIVRPDI